MIRSTYLVARRDYLGYVSAWGFWLGLLFTPVIIGIFMFAPMLAQNTQPTRYFTVIEQGDAFSNALRENLSVGEALLARAMLDPMAVIDDIASEAVESFDAAIESGASVAEAFERAGGNPALLPRPSSIVEISHLFLPVTDWLIPRMVHNRFLLPLWSMMRPGKSNTGRKTCRRERSSMLPKRPRKNCSWIARWRR